MALELFMHLVDDFGFKRQQPPGRGCRYSRIQPRQKITCLHDFCIQLSPCIGIFDGAGIGLTQLVHEIDIYAN
ncbi:MAG: hypothetical protein KJS87_04930 [Alphaproteobacteria bacterium]|nr:hypothetical protein [Alphaproteobacteria bacterium]